MVLFYRTIGLWRVLSQILTLRETANRPVEIVLAVGQRLVDLYVPAECSMALHEEQRESILSVGDILVAQVSVLGLGKARHDGFLGRRIDFRGATLGQFGRL